jgi:DNA helicase-2/ATP-dependent DNA helicase PcrA
MDEQRNTEQQNTIIRHDGTAFIAACPGAGKTRCIVERARKLLSQNRNLSGIAFLSFTNAAISELDERLRFDGLLSTPTFPHFVGTFDSFIWHYLVEPFGIDVKNRPLRLVPDTGSLMVTAYPGSREFPLNMFDRSTGAIDQGRAGKEGFKSDPTGFERASTRVRAKLKENGDLDFQDVRDTAMENLNNPALSSRLASVLRARFKEIIVDEAQDCNPEDLFIVNWLYSTAHIPTKVVCDPHQSIYGFRGGVNQELFDFADTFRTDEHLPLTGNFRSSSNICKAVHMLRAPRYRGDEDMALGKNRGREISIYILSYSGKGVNPTISTSFLDLAGANGFTSENCRIVAKTKSSGNKANGIVRDAVGRTEVMKLADAAMKFQYSLSLTEKLKAVVEAHKISLSIAGELENKTYHQAINDLDIENLALRGQFVKILGSLKYDVDDGNNRNEWVQRARTQYSPFLPAGGRTISQILRNEAKLDDVLGFGPSTDLVSKTVHEVKGKEYPAVCIVLTSSSLKSILTYLEEEPNEEWAEEARVLYVAASRAQELLVFACPRSQSKRLKSQLEGSGAVVEITEI